MVAGTNDSIDGYEFCCALVPATLFLSQTAPIYLLGHSSTPLVAADQGCRSSCEFISPRCNGHHDHPKSLS